MTMKTKKDAAVSIVGQVVLRAFADSGQTGLQSTHLSPALSV
jgi:hypothetical protein